MIAARLALASYRSRFKGADVKFARLRSSLAMIPAFAVSRLNARGCVAIAMPLQKLSDASRPASNEAAKVYRWIEFANKGEQITEFDESHFQLEGHFESNSSEGHKVFQDRLRAIHFRKEGKTKAEIAGLLGRSEQFVAKWWQKDEREVPRPWGVHEYMSKELGSKTATSAALLGEDSATSTAAWWRDVEVRRRYAADPAIYEELLKNTEWKSSAARTRDFSTGASHVKYDKEGKMKLQGNQGAKYKQGSSPAFDQLLQQFFAEYGLADRTAGIALNWYPDGDSVLGSHRHDCWTALFSFGHERILTIDKTPLLLQDCDLVIFGTQRHGVPKMPEVEGGRITVPIFFYPTQMQMKKQWQTLTDPEDPRRSNELAKLQSTHQLGADQNEAALWSDSHRAQALCSLVQLGFEETDAKKALQSAHFDPEEAAELLLLAGCNCCDLMALPASSSSGSSSQPSAPAASQPRNRWAKREKELEKDVALALQLQMDGLCDVGVAGEDADAAFAAQLEEEEAGADVSFLLAQQFEEYEQQMRREDAEKWHGKGDLMQSNFVRETLSLPTMDKASCLSIGHGQISERSFFELLQVNSVRVLYDFRHSDHRGDVHSPCEHFSVRALKSSCRVRGLAYKHVALGRETAYGILKHVKTDEAQHALIELVWHAKRGGTCFLGFDQDWRLDRRQVIADEVVAAGHSVKHINSTGSTEDHDPHRKLPDFIVSEEERLRKLEQQRRAGELLRPEKSAVDRSSEAVASQLMRPSKEIDAMDELRAAANQVELERAQRNLARLQRLGDKHGALAHKVVKAAPQWVLDEARQQEEWIAKKKAEKLEKAEKAEKAPDRQESEATEALDEELSVECSRCGVLRPWSQLAEGDGVCKECWATSGEGDVTRSRCCSCEAELPKDWLDLGACPACITSASESCASTVATEAEAESPQRDGDAKGWRAKRFAKYSPDA
ncbi:unnamed protein product [Effrenium voratum]|nr:unnamed protein product [Effrenium voratum]CAJ1441972.1 unnamed protein product [Effrenium voratum]